MRPACWTIYAFLPAIVWKRLLTIDWVSIVFGSMTSGEYALSGKMMALMRSKLSITTNELQPGDWIEPETCGTILRDEFLDPMGITPYRLSKAIGVPQSYVQKILRGGGVSPEMGLLLDAAFGLSPGFWSRLQTDYDLRVARRKIGDRLAKVSPLVSRAA